MGKDYIFFGLGRMVSEVWEGGEEAEKKGLYYKPKRVVSDVLKDEWGVDKDHVWSYLEK